MIKISEADSKLLSEMFSLVKNIDSRLSNLESKVNDGFNELKQQLNDQSQLIEDNFVELKEMQTVIEIHKGTPDAHNKVS